jgi:hypothetical protein
MYRDSRKVWSQAEAGVLHLSRIILHGRTTQSNTLSDIDVVKIKHFTGVKVFIYQLMHNRVALKEY